MKIKLNSPVLFLPDLNDEELTTIRKLYKNEIFLIRDESGLKLINASTEGVISGQAAINLYLQTLRKKPSSESYRSSFIREQLPTVKGSVIPTGTHLLAKQTLRKTSGTGNTASNNAKRSAAFKRCSQKFNYLYRSKK